MEKKTLIRKCDVLFSKFIRKKGYCEFKGLDFNTCEGELECCHIFSRGNKKLRHDIQNALCLCHAHHFYYTNHPSEWTEIVRKNFPEDYDYLIENRNKIQKPNYEEVYKWLNTLYEI